MLPIASGRATYLHGDAAVDSEGRLTSISATASADVTDIFGQIHVLEFVFDVDISEFGTTSPECPVKGVEELLAKNKHDNAEQSSVRFKLTPDGSIDADSVFDLMSDSAKIQ
jgi:hypothetical protein